MPAAPAPPRPRAALRVGVSGHQLNRLLESDVDLACLRARMRATLADVQRAVATVSVECEGVYTAEPLLILVSSLNEGADQLAADEARALGYVIHAPLPCPAEAYRAAFERPNRPGTEPPTATFARLAASAESVQVVDASPIAAVDCTSLAVVARTVLRHADVLIAVWDAAPAVGLERTADVVAQARTWHIPMILIDPRNPNESRLEADDEGAHTADLTTVVRGILTPPPPIPDGRRERDGLKQYLETRSGRGVGGLFGSVVRLAAWDRPAWPRLVTLGPSVARARAEWDALWTKPAPADPAIADPVKRAVGEYYVWADGLANRFATLHRDMSTTPYVLALLSAFLAVNVGDIAERIAPVVVTWLVFFMYWHAVRSEYHARWIDYRSLAEQLRQLAFLWPTGRPQRALRVRGEGSTEAPQFAWVEWYARAVARGVGLFPAVFTAERVAGCRELVIERFIRPQRTYHDRTAGRFQTVQRRLHTLALALFWATLVLATVRVVLGIAVPAYQPHWWLVAAILLPALAAGIHGFLSLGDFSNLARRSRRMSEELRPLTDRPAPPHETIENVGDMAEAAADVMGDEVLNWRVFARLKGPSLG